MCFLVTIDCILLQSIAYLNSNAMVISFLRINPSSQLRTIFFLLIKMTATLKDISLHMIFYEVLFVIHGHRSYGVLVPNRRQDIKKISGDQLLPPTYWLLDREDFDACDVSVHTAPKFDLHYD